MTITFKTRSKDGGRRTEDFKNRFTRCLAIYHRCQRVNVSITAMAHDLGVTERTIQRDLKALDHAGYTINMIEKGVYGPL